MGQSAPSVCRAPGEGGEPRLCRLLQYCWMALSGQGGVVCRKSRQVPDLPTHRRKLCSELQSITLIQYCIPDRSYPPRGCVEGRFRYPCGAVCPVHTPDPPLARWTLSARLIRLRGDLLCLVWYWCFHLLPPSSGLVPCRSLSVLRWFPSSRRHQLDPLCDVLGWFSRVYNSEVRYNSRSRPLPPFASDCSHC